MSQWDDGCAVVALTEPQITDIARQCGFDVTGRLLKFANLIANAAAKANIVPPAPCLDGLEPPINFERQVE